MVALTLGLWSLNASVTAHQSAHHWIVRIVSWDADGAITLNVVWLSDSAITSCKRSRGLRMRHCGGLSGSLRLWRSGGLSAGWRLYGSFSSGCSGGCDGLLMSWCGLGGRGHNDIEGSFFARGLVLAWGLGLVGQLLGWQARWTITWRGQWWFLVFGAWLLLLALLVFGFLLFFFALFVSFCRVWRSELEICININGSTNLVRYSVVSLFWVKKAQEWMVSRVEREYQWAW